MGAYFIFAAFLQRLLSSFLDSGVTGILCKKIKWKWCFLLVLTFPQFSIGQGSCLVECPGSRVVFCGEDLSNIAPPELQGGCLISSIDFVDRLEETECATIDFTDNFNVSNWRVGLEHSSGEVLTDDAPSAVVIKGAFTNTAANRLWATSYSLLLNEPGYITFDWRLFGEGDPEVDAFGWTLNGGTFNQLSGTGFTSGTFTTPFLNTGDRFAFVQQSNGNVRRFDALIENFIFQNAFVGRIDRNWLITDESGTLHRCEETFFLKNIAPNQIFFPPNFDGSDRPGFDCEQGFINLLTGTPFIDEDSNLSTLNDQFPIGESSACIFSEFEDVEVVICEGSKKILREWTVANFCIGRSFRQVQLIDLNDTSPPEIICPEDLTFENNSSIRCEMDINLPVPLVFDNCSNDISITTDWQFGSGDFFYSNIPLGTYPITYTATDGCGNSTNCTINITIVDSAPPVPICRFSRTVFLDQSGVTFLSAESLNSGSFDNCDEVIFLVDGKDFMELNCDDIISGGKEITLTVQEQNNPGSRNFCDVKVEVRDILPPVISGLQDMTVSCGEVQNDFSIFGEPQIVDNCSSAIEYTERANLNDCGEGQITRNWVATDASGNSSSFSQKIAVEAIVNWNENGEDIVFPDNFVTEMCRNRNELLPENLEGNLNGPQLRNVKECQIVLIDYSDEWIHLGRQTCKKLIRTWQVTDLCQYERSGGQNGRWEQIQVIDIIDNEGPEISLPGDIIASLKDGECEATLMQLPQITATDCSENIIINNDFNDQQDEIQAMFALGVTPVTFTAIDECENETSATLLVTVEDKVPPVALCQTGFVPNFDGLAPEEMIDLTADLIDQGSFDNCTPSQDLIMEVFPNQISCASLMDNGSIVLTVSDQEGNSSFCALEVARDAIDCSEPEPARIATGISMENGTPVENVDVFVNDAFFEKTDILGTISLGPLQSLEPLNIRPEKNYNHRNGVSTFDLVLMQKHLLEFKPITSPYGLIAADVNNSGETTILDLITLRKLLLFKIDSFPNNTSWRFVDAEYDFLENVSPIQQDYPESISLDPQPGINQLDFVAIKIGDLNNTVVPADLHPTGSRAKNAPYTFQTTISPLEGTELVYLELTGVNLSKIDGFQIALQFNQEMLEFSPNDLDQNASLQEKHFGMQFLNHGHLLISWNKESDENQISSFRIPFLKKHPAKSINVQLETSYWENEVYLSQDNGNNFRAFPLQLSQGFIPNEQEEKPIDISIAPNPFHKNVAFSFFTPGLSQIKIFDLNGNEIWQSDSFQKGNHQFTLNSHLFPGPGIYLAKITSDNFSETRKLILH